MIAIAERYGQSTVFMGEDMEVAGAFGMNILYELQAMQISFSTCLFQKQQSSMHQSSRGMRRWLIQFGGFAALAMNALINNAAQLRWRWGADVPLTVRIPLGQRHSGPFHANMIESGSQMIQVL